MITALLYRDLSLIARQKLDIALPVLFFVLTIFFIPFAVGPDPVLLSKLAGGVIWLAVILTNLLVLEKLFLPDKEDGSFDLLVTAPCSLEIVVLLKSLTAWLITGFPIVLMAPLAALMLHFPAEHIPILMLSLLLGTPTLTLIGMVGAALVLGTRTGSFLVALLIFPLYLPTLIFAITMLDAAIMHQNIVPFLMILTAFLVTSLTLAPFAGAAALRNHLEEG